MNADDVKNTAKDLGGTASKNVNDAAQKAQGQAADVAGQTKSALDQASSTASDLYGQAKAKARDATGDLPGSASDAMAAGRQAYEDGSKELARQVAKQPLEALLLAGAIGYLVGWATTR